MRKWCIAGSLLIAAAAVHAQARFDLSARPTAFGLYPVLGTQMEQVFARPDAGLPFFRSIYVAPVSIAYRRDRSEDGRRIEPDKLEEMSRFFRESLERHVAQSSYELVEQPTLGTLELRAYITNLRIGAGAGAEERSPAYFSSVAEMTLVIELLDATSGELLVQVVDSGQAVRSVAEQGPVTDRDTVVRLLDGWAAFIADRLDQIKRMGGALVGS